MTEKNDVKILIVNSYCQLSSQCFDLKSVKLGWIDAKYFFYGSKGNLKFIKYVP